MESINFPFWAKMQSSKWNPFIFQFGPKYKAGNGIHSFPILDQNAKQPTESLNQKQAKPWTFTAPGRTVHI